jgi:hypothetical protein
MPTIGNVQLTMVPVGDANKVGVSTRSSGTTPNNRPMFNSPKNRTTFVSGSGLKTIRFVNTVRRTSRATSE